MTTPPAPYPYTAADVLAAEFRAVREVLEDHPAVAALPWDEQNSLAQNVLDALWPWLLDGGGGDGGGA